MADLRNTTARDADPQTTGSPTLVVLVLIALAGVVAYAAFLFNPANRGDPLPYALVITAEVILITQALLSMWTILPGGQTSGPSRSTKPAAALYSTTQVRRDAVERVPSRWAIMLGGRQVAVDIFVTVYGEDIAVIEKTVRAAVAMRGQHVTWVLDDGRSDEVQALAGTLGAHYLRRPDNTGAKAGNVNHALSIATGEYFAIFDADFVPKPEFLQETLPFFTDSRVAFVQTPQVYGNLRTVVARGAAFMQSVFYRFISRGGTRSMPPSASAPMWSSAVRRPTRSAACTPAPSRRTSGRRSCCMSGDGVPSTSRLRSRSATPPSRSRTTPSSSCAGRPAGSRSCSPTARWIRGASSPSISACSTS
jgi:hypothetical protein